MKNGIKIINIEGADLLRNKIEGKYINLKYEAVFANSKLKDKISKDLSIKDFSTNDIINLKFNMPVTKIDESKYVKYKDYIKDNKISAENIRKILYKDGFELKFDKERTIKGSKKEGTKVITDYENRKYILKNRDGEILQEEEMKPYEITYKFWFRSSAKAMVGECLFINKKIHDSIVKWQTMGIELPEDEEAMVVEIMAYMSLTASTIQDYITINPNEILVIDDLKSRRLTNCAKVIVNEKNQCDVIYENDYVENTLFDGQALLDDSLFGESEAGMKLLRHHFFKACGFRTNIKLFMQNYCKGNGLDYETETLKDRYGNYIKVKNIKMITTENAMKWEKFFKDKSEGFKSWKKAVDEDNNLFGVCKEDHESKFKDKQRMSYQMLNTLPVNKEELTDIARYSIDYINKLKNKDNKAFIEHLRENVNIINENEMMIDLYERNKEFAKTELFKDFKSSTIYKLKKNLRKGKVLVNAENLTIVGNPYLMLLHSVKEVEVEDGYVTMEDKTLPKSENFISVYTKRFEDEEKLVGFRNPHNSPNNIAYFKNNRSELFEKYFNFSKNIMAINCIDTEIQDLANGCDFDSDFMFTTNDENIVKVVIKKVFRKESYACIVNKIPQSKNKYINTLENKAIIDNKLAKGKYDTGTSSNQAQISMSLFANSGYKDKELLKSVIILSVLAQVSIDNAKRQYEVELNKEINRLTQILNSELKEKDEGEVVTKIKTDKKGKIKITEKAIKKAKRPLFFYYITQNKDTEYRVYNEETKYKGVYKNKYQAQEIKNKIINDYIDKHKGEKIEEDKIAMIKEKGIKKEKDSFNEKIKCTMNYLQEIISKEIINESKKKGEKIETKDLIVKIKGKAKHEQLEKIKELVENWNKSVKKFNADMEGVSEEEMRSRKTDFSHEEAYLVELIIEKIKKMSITDKTINSLILSTLRKDSKTSNSHIRLKLLNVLYQSKKEQFLNQFIEIKVS
ncbi:hypothetical protein A500_04571 [Clostridium sartagoforme AAU1]|uniref:Phage related protein n=1 Tax=Clostridium sartagoforme AAU1 TaxID=1202534 RepID=R9CDM6_9CLOT|nr:hypothetical protein [Clostridium sartagoforme]EOR27387.1 hypothetical protein A500_04571 [Clostridium sartagoforme AAU1]